MTKSILYEELHPKELEEIIKTNGIVYVPLGTLEWHERHLPYGLDSMVSYHLAKEVCKQTGGCVIPPLYFGTDREHDINGKLMHGMDAKAGELLLGNIYFLKQDLFFELVRSIISNLVEYGFKKIVVISAHSGTAQQNVLEDLEKEDFGDISLITFPGRKFKGGIDHAALIETNMMLGIRPDLVHLDRLSKPYKGLGGDDPMNATEKDGKEILEKIVNQIVESVKD